jgi:hypothetical protein
MDDMEVSLKEWLDHNLPSFLTKINSELINENPWKMPTVEDFVLVVSVRDYEDGLGGVFTISNGAPSYRIRGLIAEAMSM